MRGMAMRIALLVGLVAGAADLAEAGSVAYDISGQFGPELFPTETTGLEGGSFKGTYSVTGLPIPTGSHLGLNLDSFDVILKNSQGQTLYELTNTSFIGSIANSLFVVGETFLHIGTSTGSGINLNLIFTSPTPFNGVASVISHSRLGPQYSAVASANAITTIISGSSVLASTSAVPEPSSVVMLGLGACGLIGAVVRARRSA